MEAGRFGSYQHGNSVSGIVLGIPWVSLAVQAHEKGLETGQCQVSFQRFPEARDRGIAEEYVRYS